MVDNQKPAERNRSMIHMNDSNQQDRHLGTPMTDESMVAGESEGGDRIFGISGEMNPDVVKSLRPGAFKAATYGRLTGKPGICISVLGPGMLNFCFISRIRS